MWKNKNKKLCEIKMWTFVNIEETGDNCIIIMYLFLFPTLILTHWISIRAYLNIIITSIHYIIDIIDYIDIIVYTLYVTN